MRQRTWDRVWAIGAGVAVAALLLAESGSDTQAQTFNDAIQGALQNQCSGLSGPGGSYQGTLNTICSNVPGAVGTSSGASIASQALGQQGADQRRIPLRLEGQRPARPEGRAPAAGPPPPPP